MTISGMSDSLQADAVCCLDGLIWCQTLSNEDMELLERERGFWDSQKSWDKSLQGLDRVGQICEALMGQGMI